MVHRTTRILKKNAIELFRRHRTRGRLGTGGKIFLNAESVPNIPFEGQTNNRNGAQRRYNFFFFAEGLLPSILQFFSKRRISAGTNKDPRPCRNDLLWFFFSPFVPRHVFRVLRNEVCSVYVSSSRWADAIANRSTEELRKRFWVSVSYPTDTVRRHFTFFMLGALIVMATQSKVTFISCTCCKCSLDRSSYRNSSLNRRSMLVISCEVVVSFLTCNEERGVVISEC